MKIIQIFVSVARYGKDRFGRFFDKIIGSDSLLYIDKEKSQQLFTRIGLQLPQLANNTDFNTIIHKSRNAVNTFSENNSDFRFSRKAAPGTDTSLDLRTYAAALSAVFPRGGL